MQIKKKVLRSFKRALNPNRIQKEMLWKSCRATEWVYNKALYLMNENYFATKGFTLIEKRNDNSDKVFTEKYITGTIIQINGMECLLETSPGVCGIITGYYDKNKKLTIPKKKKHITVLKYSAPEDRPKLELEKVLTSRTSEIIKQLPFKDEIYSVEIQTLHRGVKRLQQAFKNFWKGKSKHPQFKDRNSNRSFYVHNRVLKIWDNEHVRLGMDSGLLKSVKLQESLIIPEGAKIESGTVSFDGQRWYLSVCCSNVEILREGPSSENIINGIDLNSTQDTSVVLSDGTVYKSKRPTKYFEKRLKRLNRKASKCKKGSNNQKKLYLKIGKLHNKISNIRKDSISKVSTDIANNSDIVILEDLNIAGMMKTRVAKGMADSAHSELKNQLIYKINDRNKGIFEVNRFFPSSQLCNGCNTKSLKFKNREVQCSNEQCMNFNKWINRDSNASRNLRDEYLRGNVVNIGEKEALAKV